MKLLFRDKHSLIRANLGSDREYPNIRTFDLRASFLSLSYKFASLKYLCSFINFLYYYLGSNWLIWDSGYRLSITWIIHQQLLVLNWNARPDLRRWKNEWMNEWMMNEWMNERMNEWLNEWRMNECVESNLNNNIQYTSTTTRRFLPSEERCWYFGITEYSLNIWRSVGFFRGRLGISYSFFFVQKLDLLSKSFSGIAVLVCFEGWIFYGT
jgi:hypothetical protein